MKQLKNSLLITGIGGLIFGTIGFFVNPDITMNLMTTICGACLVFGYFDLRKKTRRSISE